ncbi:FAD-binding protein (plasmid) [Chromobacterium amazonense]|nr:FAD-binding protein [Chromobacterium amazonense]MDE1714352.1 FAD-binding protein [Chromobacterium amazonense]
MNDFLQQLAAIIGRQHVLTSAADTAPFTLDWRRRYQGAPLAVARPGSTAEVSELVKLCRAHQVAIVPQGGNTSTCGAATPDGSGRQLIVALRRLNARNPPAPATPTVPASPIRRGPTALC